MWGFHAPAQPRKGLFMEIFPSRSAPTQEKFMDNLWLIDGHFWPKKQEKFMNNLWLIDDHFWPKKHIACITYYFLLITCPHIVCNT